ncbi:MAG: hypothetical protein JWQ34_1747 [Mucilaginibacter sp.]|uniref:hypothetical protein n=1 Tax=Mucilaginibacter sp. TaxID=1882438 RepID=UPI00262CB9C4|nr:hypothetical protein [Mucilaginibacter sp.]MDB5003522.1 hypothetical protein [Mucilaginibacter sp.]
MIEKTFKTIHGQLRIQMPSQLKEITLGQMMQMQDKLNLSDLDAINILSGTPIDELKNVIDIHDFDVFGEAVLSLSNQIKHLYNSDDIPTNVSFDIDDKKVMVKVIRNLSVEPAGAFMAARDIIADEINEHITLHGEEDWQERFNPSLKACCLVLAQYFYCRATGNKYNEYQAEVFTETVKKLGVLEALPIAKHFFMSYPNLSKPKTNYFLRLRQFWRKKPVSNHSRSLSI